MKGLTRSQLLEYVRIKRDGYYEAWEAYKAAGDDRMADKMWTNYDELDTIYRCMTDNDFAKCSYKIWTGKEL